MKNNNTVEKRPIVRKYSTESRFDKLCYLNNRLCAHEICTNTYSIKNLSFFKLISKTFIPFYNRFWYVSTNFRFFLFLRLLVHKQSVYKCQQSIATTKVRLV